MLAQDAFKISTHFIHGKSNPYSHILYWVIMFQYRYYTIEKEYLQNSKRVSRAWTCKSLRGSLSIVTLSDRSLWPDLFCAGILLPCFSPSWSYHRFRSELSSCHHWKCARNKKAWLSHPTFWKKLAFLRFLSYCIFFTRNVFW